MAKQVVLWEHDPRWAGIFARESRLITTAAGPCCLAMHHVGSTAVPGLAAKPIVDILLVCTGLPDLEARRARFETVGYVWLGENGIAGRRYFTKETDESPMETVHLHVYAAGHADIEQKLSFRDYLRANPRIAADYAALKRRLLAKFADDRAAYTEGKGAFIAAVLARATEAEVYRRRVSD